MWRVIFKEDDGDDDNEDDKEDDKTDGARLGWAWQRGGDSSQQDKRGTWR